jgi:tRNA splicing endonuclease
MKSEVRSVYLRQNGLMKRKDLKLDNIKSENLRKVTTEVSFLASYIYKSQSKRGYILKSFLKNPYNLN